MLRVALLVLLLLVGLASPLSPAGPAAPLERALAAIVVVTGETPEHAGYLGAGVHIGGGYVLTNKHLTKGHQTMMVTLGNGERVNAQVVKEAEGDDIDAALMHLPYVPQDLPALTLDQRPLVLNEDVYLLSHPAGLTWTLTRGYVMTVNRQGGYQLFGVGIGGISGGAVVRPQNLELTAITRAFIPDTPIAIAIPLATVCKAVGCPTQ